MKKYLILIILFSGFVAYASAHAGGGASLIVVTTPVEAAADPYATCSSGKKLFDWDCSVSSMGSNVCSLGDTSASSVVGEADINTSNTGKLTLTDESDNGNDYFNFALSSYDIFPAGDLTLEVTINFSATASGAIIYSIYLDGNNYFQLVISGATRDIYFTHRGDGTSTAHTFDVNLDLDTEYDLVVKYGTTNGMALSIDGGSSYTTDADKDITTMTHGGTNATGVYIGNDAAQNLEGTIDNVRVSSGWRTDI